MKHNLAWLFSGSVAALALACSSTAADGGGAGGDGASTGGASAAAVDGCKRGCDKMKFFDCSSADELAACYGDCKSASADQIEVFTSCAENSICDPQCRTSIVPKKPGSTGTPKGEGATPDSCGSACEKLVSCSFIKLGEKDACVAQCKTEAYQFQIDCVNNNACGSMEKACGGVGGSTETGGGGGASSSGGGGGTDVMSITHCKEACKSAKFFSCIDATAFEACNLQCDESSAGDRDTFSACVEASSPACDEVVDCYNQF